MKKLILAFAIGILSAMPSLSFAIEEKFFEFATDVGVPIAVPTNSVAVQVFTVHNDSIHAVDVWFDNVGSSGSATVALLSSTNAVLASRTVTVSHADPFYAGERLHVNFNKTIGVTSGALYKIRITSATPSLRLYGVKRVEFIEHNAPYVLSDSVGASLLNDEVQVAVFKFALYEENDIEPPIITNATSTIAGPDAIRISFNANELVDKRIEYTLTGSGDVSAVDFTGNYAICFEDTYSCPTTIPTQRDSVYTYRLTVRDSMGNESFFDGSFMSWKPGTPTPIDEPVPEDASPATPTEPIVEPLVISQAQVVSTDTHSAKITWETNRAADSVLIISTDSLGVNDIATVRDDTHELVHTLTANVALVANANYYATVLSRDAQAVLGVQALSFLIPASSTEIISEQPSSGVVVFASTANGTQAPVLTWQASSLGEPRNGYRVDVIDAQGNLVRSITVAAGNHSVAIDELEGGAYQAIVYANNDGVLEKIAKPVAVVVKKPVIDTYALIKKPIVYIPSTLFVMLIAGLFVYSRRQRKVKTAL
ncbi:MAG: hypothetical protein ACD_81C00196G0003 [uncultured bacterium]|uniref:Fibronectin type-III domain-containing protein n=1 Tax=Candidatus Wolfebacteria bacterium GW2011_GWE2_44_13 TaxID=1619017 RepID=A0A0G1HAQ1_9BACT|nr:MAG: hypothetical protein ACD_81C00196G0003 [uncultured bacterium]KKT43593.1 MAG: hypothetical protein UW32_C0001G0185 [Candidatus Wolfebacteria bacterium GW2011_GWE2_44_13]